MIYLIIIGAILVLLVLFVIVLYNRFVRLTNRVKEGWADIETQLKRRYDLIPNLINTVKGYAKHEKETFAQVTEMRTNAINQHGTPAKQGLAENMLSGALKSLFAVAENYPDLKANTNFLELQKELTDTENKIQAARRFYNTVVLDLNNACQTFPSNIVAGIFGFKQKEFFELDEAERDAAEKPVGVSF
ncbi:MAG: LemA family protein [Candidatus Campbellbacteria bacterium]|nr:LemA family protein [Candidatus Campbellbacteria bacterium]